MVISMVITMVKMATMQHDSAYTIKQITALTILLPGGAIIWFLEKHNNSEQTRIAHPATILPLVGQKPNFSTQACINFENKCKNKI